MLGLGLNLTSITAALLDFVRSGLKMWLPFSKDGSDKSTDNSNNATLYTGKALSFDGNNDYVAIDDFTMTGTTMTMAFWSSIDSNGGYIFNKAAGSGSQFIVRYDDGDKIRIFDGATYHDFTTAADEGYKRYVIVYTSSELKLYVNGTQVGSTVSNPADLSIASTSNTKIGSNSGASGNFFEGKLSDLQIYDVAWTQADVTFDYENPQHLVTDNPSIVKTYGSEIVTDGGFDDASEWNANTGWTVSGGKASVDSSGTTEIRQTLSVTKGKIYDLTFELSDYVEGAFQLGYNQFNIAETSSNLPNFNKNGVYNYRVVALGNNIDVYMYAIDPSEFSIDNLSLKEETSLNVSNIKGYWHLSEGAGSYAYNSAVALGSELVTGWTNSDFDSFTSSGSNITQMVSGASADNCYSNSLTVTSGKTYKVEFTSSQNLSTNCQVRVSANTNLTSANVVSSSVSAGLNTFVFTATGSRSYIGFYAAGSFTDTQITNFSFKEVSAGAIINGATASPQQATIPQLGLMDWSKPTIGSDVVTLISDPNDPSKDILGNDVRLREHSLNLDGSGYAQVADDNSINPTSAITVACWVYWNETLSNGTRTNDIGIVSKWKSSTEDYMLIKGTDTTFDFYIGTDFERSNDLGMDTPGWVYIAGTYDGSTIKTYKNGVSNSIGTSVSRTIPNTAQVLEIGRYRETVDRSYPERIDEVKIYERALSPEELLQNYNAGLSQHKPGSAFSDDFSSDYGL